MKSGLRLSVPRISWPVKIEVIFERGFRTRAQKAYLAGGSPPLTFPELNLRRFSCKKREFSEVCSLLCFVMGPNPFVLFLNKLFG